MMYRLNRNLFVENGAAALAEKSRAARLSVHEHELTRNADKASVPNPVDRKAA